MPKDIRSFFGGNPSSQPKSTPETDKAATKSKRAQRVVDDSDDEEAPPSQKSAPKKTQPKPANTSSSVATETTASAYFGSTKPRRSQPENYKSSEPTGADVGKPDSAPSRNTRSAKNTPTKERTTNGRSAARSSARKTRNVVKDESSGEDIFEAEYKGRSGKNADDYEESSEDDLEPSLPVRESPRKQAGRGQLPDTKSSLGYDGTSTGRATGKGTKRKSTDLDDEDDFLIEEPKKPKRAAAAKSTPKKSKSKAADVEDNAETRAILDSIPIVRPPSPEPTTEKKSGFNPHAANTGPPPGAGSKEIPTGAENCLAGLSFVFTGLLPSIERTEAQNLAKRYGGKVVGAPSKKTDYVVLGQDAGPKKLRTIKENQIKTIDEDGFLELIRRMPAHGGGTKGAAQYEEKVKKEAEKAREEAAKMDAEDRKRAAAQAQSKSHIQGKTPQASQPNASAEDRLWTVKYAPTALSQICGNKTAVEKLQNWLHNFENNKAKKFKLAGKDGSGGFRAVIIHGPPGIGKTTAAHLVAKMEGYDVVESNASDTRSKKLVEQGLRGVLSTTSLLGYFAGDGRKVESSKRKLVLIMDEVDGMSAGDRGGVGALAAVCKKTSIPIILICNDRKQPKMKPFDRDVYDLPFRRPTVDQIRSRITTIIFREKLKMPTHVVNSLIEGSSQDIRQVVNMISAAKLDQQAAENEFGIDGDHAGEVDFDKGKQMSKAWQKNVILRPWDITQKILGGGLFSDSSKTTLNEKAELYFNDHEFSPLMLQENYLSTNPLRAREGTERMRRFRALELASQAADSISDGDLIDKMIHGPQQLWALMPLHAMFSFVRPASFVAGPMKGGPQFTSWLGKNSSAGRLSRTVKEIQAHMRLRCSGDRHEIRQQYLPLLWSQLVKKMEAQGKEAIPGIIELMDAYYLTKDDFEAIGELGIGPMANIDIDSQTKAAFTRMYNSQSHPLPFIRALPGPATKKVTKEKPDLEEAMEESDDGEVLEEPKDEDDGDLSKDKYVAKPKKKAKGTKRAKAAVAADDEDDGPAPKKGKGAAKGKAGKGKK